MHSNSPKSAPKSGLPKTLRRANSFPLKVGRSKLNRTSPSLFAITALSVFTLFTAGTYYASAETTSKEAAVAPQIAAQGTSPSIAGVTAVKKVKFTSAVSVEPCIQKIEYELERLYITVQSPDLKDQKASRIRRLAQTTLDCKTASMNINGSLELVLTDFAILGVEWDRETSVLGLNVVNNIQQTAYDTLYSNDGHPVSFYIP